MKRLKTIFKYYMHEYSFKYKLSFQHIKTFLALFMLVSFFNIATAQKFYIKLGSLNLAQNEVFTISLVVENEQFKNYSAFPEIPGFQKAGTSSQSSTNFVNGQMSSSQSIIMNYRPTKEGKFKLAPFDISINGNITSNNGGLITVGPPKQVQRQQDPFAYDPFEEFFGGGRGAPKEFVEVKDDAFFAMTSNKDQVFVGEGVTMTLAFYVAKSNQAEMQFYELGKQLGDIFKKIKPENCWEENFGIEEIQPEQVVINGKPYDEFKLYRGTFYPLKNESITFPSVGLKMLKFKVSKTPSFMNNRKEDFKIFYTKDKIIKVKDLPAHPLKGQVSVGNYTLNEVKPNKVPTTGKSFNYSFEIKGEGNISSITNPVIIENNKIEVYPPNVQQNISRSGLSVTGSKVFNYFIIPKEPGKTELRKYLNWIYFNVKTARYDTLKPQFSFEVKGESIKNTSIKTSGKSEILEMANEVSDQLISKDDSQKYISWINYGVLLLLIITIFIILKK